VLFELLVELLENCDCPSRLLVAVPELYRGEVKLRGELLKVEVAQAWHRDLAEAT
jgi:hypothetical protein